jgi:hypothetical protein
MKIHDEDPRQRSGNAVDGGSRTCLNALSIRISQNNGYGHT